MSLGKQWLPCSEVTLQGNVTIDGFSAKNWQARPSVCEIHLHENSGMARIDWHHCSVLVSAAVIQHATLDAAREHVERREGTVDVPQVPSASDLTLPKDKPLEEPKVAEPQTRADEILAEFTRADESPRRRVRKPKAD